MEPKHILWLTICPAAGGGYAAISIPLCNALAEAGHDVKMLALDNWGEEHWNKFSILPTTNLQEMQVSVHNLKQMWGVDLIITALDLPLQEMILNNVSLLAHEGGGSIPYIAITPMENGPLIKSVGMALSQVSKVFFISKYAVSEAAKIGLESEFMPVALDTDFWCPVTAERKAIIKKTMGFDSSDFVIFTVAENQERKNLASALEAVALFKKQNPEISFRYVLVSTEYHPYEHSMGNRLQELAQDLGLVDNFVLFNKGMSNEQLRLLFQMSDTFLLTSKAEGLGLPILEAMACGLQIVATNTGALTELLDGGRGYLVDPAYTFTDVWMNSKRDMISIPTAAECLFMSTLETLSGGREYVESLKGKNVEAILKAVEEVKYAN